MNALFAAVVIAVVAILGALFFAFRGKSSEKKSVRILIFGIYFWVLVFVQVVIAGFAYQFLK
jgi:hypothetical protein